MNKPIRVLICDDSAFMRRAIRTMLTTDPGIVVVDAARNGREGVELAKKHKPDVMTLDIEMPEMDGLTALRHVMREAPTRVLMLSSLTTAGSVASLQALRLGAADVLAKDMSQVSLSISNIQDDLLTRVRALGEEAHRKTSQPDATVGPHTKGSDPVSIPVSIPPASEPLPTFRAGQFDAICIGSSTGGPPVLETLLAGLPTTLRTPIVIAQHMPALFTRSMAQRLDEVCPAAVVHAEDGMPLENGHVYIAPGEQHTHLIKTGLARYALKVSHEPVAAVYRPSVDALFESAAAAAGRRTLAIILTGIGDDGLRGARALHALDAPILAQTAESCVVYGMPKAVTQAALTTASLSPANLHQVLVDLAAKAAA